ncbi:MAG: NAD-dependent succinate-semialdehyde dehydrogenase [Pseudomonadales bacterium]
MQLSDPSLLRSQALIDGAWVDADDGSTFAVTNPATGETLAQVARCGAAEATRAIAAAERAMADWRRRTATERGRLLRAWNDALLAHQEDLARLLTAEQGKPLAEARGEIAYGASYIEWFAEEARRVYGDTIPGPAPDKRIVCLKEPIGVVGCITPWNFPNAMLARKLAPALAAGCTVVCKPANETPLSAFAMAALAEQAGIPPGVVNVLCGHTSEIGETLTGSKIVRKLSFTGSTRVGQMLMAACAATVKRTSMELGGNAPFIVFDDADLDAAVAGALASKFRNAGQTCVCANRMLVQSGVFDAFAGRLAEAVSEFRLGNGAEEGVTMGPLIHEQAADKVMDMLDEALAGGARLVTGGKLRRDGGSFIEPAVLTGVTPQMRVFNEEIFGPVAPLIRFDTEAEAIALANDTDFGLASYFYSRDVGRIFRVAEALEYGIVGVNEGIISNAMAPFGGVKFSGNGREGSKYGLDDYLEIKYLCLGGIDR